MDLIWAQLEELRPKEVEVRTQNLYLCSYCQCPKMANEDMIPTCTNCGITDDQFVSDEPEWRSGVDDDGTVTDPSRVGMPADTVLFSEAWGTGTIMNVNKFANAYDKKIARINFHTSMNHKDRSLFHAYADLENAGKNILNLPSTITRDAKIMYRSFNSEKLTRGAVRLGIKANCILWACKKAGVPRTTQEVAEAFSIPPRDISRTEHMFRDVVEQENGQIVYPSDVLMRFFNNLTVVPEIDKRRVKTKIVNMCKDIQKSSKLMGKTPKGTASAVMFVTLNEMGYKVDKGTVCNLCEVSLPTLNKLEPIVRAELKKLLCNFNGYETYKRQ